MLPLPDFVDETKTEPNRKRSQIGGRFGSAHPESWNAAYCDGSVRTMGYDIDWRLHCDQGNRLDGKLSH